MPPHWRAVDARFGEKQAPFQLGFHDRCRTADVNRFAARYRVARAFQGLRLEGFGEGTQRGYDALTSVAFAWSALEMLAGIYGHKWPGGIATREFDERFLVDVRSIAEHEAFVRAAAIHIDKEPLRKEIGLFLKKEQCSALAIPAMIRHIFLHGTLTPNAGKIDDDGDTAVALCEISRSFLLAVIDASWTQQLLAKGVIDAG